jgi:6-phosphofructo-2-kinase/fructose-2,6-biphosphatase
MQTLKHLPIQPVQWAALNEIDAGVCDGMTYHEIAETMPEEYAARQKDKLRYRYPRGESYQDVILRLEPVIIEAERQRTPVLIVAHQAVLRALYAYFMDMAPEDCLRKDIPLHTVIELTPGPYSFEEKQFPLM